MFTIRREFYGIYNKEGILIHSIHFYYGLNPIPNDYILQTWLDHIHLVIPQEENNFTSYPNQKKLLKDASDHGLYMKINVNVHFKDGIEFIEYDDIGVPFKDVRRFVVFQFCSPYFTKWDEIFYVNDGGEWVLKWKWRLSDFDGMLAAEDSKKFKNYA